MKKVFVTVAALAALLVAGCSSCNPADPLQSAPDSCNPAEPVVNAAPDCSPMAAAAPASLCGPLPVEARPGEAWCCEAIPQAAPPPARVCTCPETVHRTQIPAEYETVSEQVEVSPAKTEWRRIECATSGGAECWIIVETPPVFEMRSRQRLVREAFEKVEYTPAVFENVASAPPAPVYRWVRREDCAPPTASSPPAGSVPAPAGR